MSRKKKYFEYKLGHGWFGGYMKQTDVISTIDSGMANWHILIAEMFDDVNELIEREREFLSRIAQRWDFCGHMTMILSTYLPGWFTTVELCSMA